MAKSVLITLTLAGADTGPFSLYSNDDGYITPFETGVGKIDLTSGYTSVVVPDAATIIRVQSEGPLCTNYVDLIIGDIPTTTTTTTGEPTTTTTSTTFYDCGECWAVQNENVGDSIEIAFNDCFGAPDTLIVSSGTTVYVCSIEAPICVSGGGLCAQVSIIQDSGANCVDCPSLG